jgi:hypothetical protein
VQRRRPRRRGFDVLCVLRAAKSGHDAGDAGPQAAGPGAAHRRRAPRPKGEIECPGAFFLALLLPRLDLFFEC